MRSVLFIARMGLFFFNFWVRLVSCIVIIFFMAIAHIYTDMNISAIFRGEEVHSTM